MNPSFHPPSVCPSAHLSSFHLPHTETHQWGPHPSSAFYRHFCPVWGTHFTLGHPFLYFVHFFPHFFLYKHLLLQTFVFLSSPLATCFPFWPHATHVTLGWSIPSHFPLLTSSIYSEHDPGHLPLSSAFIYLVPPLAQLTFRSCHPHDTRSCPNGCGHALYHTSSNQGSSGVIPLFGFVYVPLPPHHISRFTRSTLLLLRVASPFCRHQHTFPKG